MTLDSLFIYFQIFYSSMNTVCSMGPGIGANLCCPNNIGEGSQSNGGGGLRFRPLKGGGHN